MDFDASLCRCNLSEALLLLIHKEMATRSDQFAKIVARKIGPWMMIIEVFESLILAYEKNRCIFMTILPGLANMRLV
jgi:hypothetical protein